ncbi:inner-membrane translocator [Ferroglobus placidus DSM 10642]|uniref:Inner-membrane translocator n=1 Tax=Ferroglobus placidus (strain DSM 10642 / AEDII12DO) TaxID=589924 RepID=D3RXJ4_FERPA|nr:branched-chain amino acid ABC transporter permease [Ferroglobus placidus]ADC65207.1 inner-membrane translocator [Ferroglobus placidus DSM 10642]
MRGLKNYLIGLIGLIVALTLPFYTPEGYLFLFGMLFLFLILVLSWDIIVGYTGQVNLGHTVFVGLGAYTAALLQVPSRFESFSSALASMPPQNQFLSILIGGIVAALFGAAIGFVTLRLKGYYFALVTAILPLVFIQTVYVFSDVFGGEEGFSIGLERALSQSPVVRYYVAFAVFLLCFLAMRYIVKSDLGYRFMAVRDDEELAEALGIDVVKYKVLAFTISSFFAGVAGATIVLYRITVGPDLYDIPLMLMIILSAVLGGLGTLYGPLIGGIIVYLLKNLFLKTMIPQGAFVNDEIVLYAILIAVALLSPEGLWHKIRSSLRS